MTHCIRPSPLGAPHALEGGGFPATPWPAAILILYSWHFSKTVLTNQELRESSYNEWVPYWHPNNTSLAKQLSRFVDMQQGALHFITGLV